MEMFVKAPNGKFFTLYFYNSGFTLRDYDGHLVLDASIFSEDGRIEISEHPTIKYIDDGKQRCLKLVDE